MPSTYAHRRFGAQAAARLPEELRGIVSRHRALYDIGLHGPDILFYYHALRSNPISARGGAMHDQPGSAFFAAARGLLREAEDQEAALAYLLGFICHFALDSTCHPYVEKYTREQGITHCEIETEFDNQLMREDGLDPLRFFTAGHIRPTEENARIIAPFYNGLTTAQVEGALRGMVTIHRCLQASNPAKRWLVLTVMRLAGKYDGLHGLVANPQPNPDCAESGRQLEQLYTQALPLAVRLMTEYAADEPLDPAYQHTFGED